MKTTIYYFTGTGNSLKIARSICDLLEDCELIAIAKIWQKNNFKSTSEKVGFVFPLYYSGLPKIVFDFIEEIDVSNSDYFFIVVISGGGTSDLPSQQIAEILNTKDKLLNAEFLIKMPSNYIIEYEVDSEEQQKAYFEKASEEVKTITEIINMNYNNLEKRIFEKDLTKVEIFNRRFREGVNKSDKSFYVDENCNSCGLCEKLCPVDNIELIEGKPQWYHRCQQCLACINYCPEKSIQFGNKTKKTQRYHHPEITPQDIANQKG